MVSADTKSESAKAMYETANPCPTDLLEDLMRSDTMSFALHQPDFVALADAWVHERA